MLAGSKLRTRIGVLEVTAVDKVRKPTRQGRACRRLSRRAAPARLVRRSATGDLYRIALHLAGPDPRIALRELPPDEAVFAKLDRMGEWTYEYLRAIAENPGKRAPDLAESFGRETAPFKRDVRKLKELGPHDLARDRLRALARRGQAHLRAHLNGV